MSDRGDATPAATPIDYGSFAGPRVRVQRGQSADAGGGMLSVFAGWIQIQGAVRSRQLGAMQDLRSIVFHDRQGTDATMTFSDGAVWSVEGGAAGELLTFMLEIESRLSSPGLVQQAPPIADEIAKAVTPDLKRDIAAVIAACVLVWGLTVAVRMWSPLGYVFAAVVAVGLVTFFLGRESIGPLFTSHWAGFCEEMPVVVGALAVALLVGAALGMSQAADDRVRAAVEQAAQDRQAALDRAEAEAKAQARAAELRQVEPLLTQMTEAIQQKAWADAQTAHDAIVKLDPTSAAAAAVRPMIEAGVVEQREAARRKAFMHAVAQIPRLAKDKVQCESAGIVGSLWQGLLGGTSADPEWPQVDALVPKLEACRRRVVAVYGSSATDSLRMQRSVSARALERTLRERGEDVTVVLKGSDDDKLEIAGAAIDAAWVDRLTEAGARVEGSFLHRWQKDGIRVVEFSDARKPVRSYEMDPAGAAASGMPVLERFGLSEPLRLPSP